jgi:hypothetical protein
MSGNAIGANQPAIGSYSGILVLTFHAVLPSGHISWFTTPTSGSCLHDLQFVARGFGPRAPRRKIVVGFALQVRGPTAITLGQGRLMRMKRFWVSLKNIWSGMLVHHGLCQLTFRTAQPGVHGE